MKMRGSAPVALALVLSLLAWSNASAATTISTNISTEGTLAVTGASTLTGAVSASSTLMLTGALSTYGAGTFGDAVGDTQTFTGLAVHSNGLITASSTATGFFGVGGQFQASSTSLLGGALTTYGTGTFGDAVGDTQTFTGLAVHSNGLITASSTATGFFGVGGQFQASSTALLGGALTTYGAVTLGDAVADNITFTGTVAGASPLAFDGATDDGFETTFAFTDPGADFTLTFPAETGTVVTTGSSNIVTGMVTNDTLTASDLAATLTFADADLVDFGSNVTSATEGLILPKHATNCATATAEGQVCWQSDTNVLYVGDGASAASVAGSTGGVNTWTDNQIFTFVGDEDVAIGSTAATITTGVLGLTVAAGDAAVDGINIGLTQNDGATGSVLATGLEMLLTGNDASGTMAGLTITAASTANSGAGTYLAGITIDNADTTATSMTDGILITSSGVNLGVTDAIDASAANILNAINIGSNNIQTGTGGTVNFARSDAGVVTLTAVDDDATAAITLDAGGAADIVIGSADVTQINLITDEASATDVNITGGLTVSTDIVVTGSDITLGAAGVKFTGDGDGAVTLLGLGDGTDEDLTINLDDTSDTVVLSSSTGVVTLSTGALAITNTAGISTTGSMSADAYRVTNGTTVTATGALSKAILQGASYWAVDSSAGPNAAVDIDLGDAGESFDAADVGRTLLFGLTTGTGALTVTANDTLTVTTVAAAGAAVDAAGDYIECKILSTTVVACASYAQ